MRFLLLIAAGLSLAACAPAVSSVPEKAFTISGFSNPESVLHDTGTDVYLVSNVNGPASLKDGNGFISRVAPDGKITQRRWIASGVNGVTLNAPKGMAISGKTLYVTDIDVVRLFDAVSGAPTGTVAVPGATFLNDLVAAPGGGVYLSDSGLTPDFGPSGTDSVQRITPDAQLQPVASGEALAHPNGLTVLPGGKLQVVPFGSNTAYQLGTDGQQLGKQALPKGGLDGVEAWNGGLLITSWEASALYFLDGQGAVQTLAENLKSPADLGLDSKRARALVPLLDDNVVKVVPLKR